MDKFSYFSNAHVAYIDELYQDFKQDPESIDPSWKSFFDGFDFALTKFGEEGNGAGSAAAVAEPPVNGNLATRGTMMDMEQLPKEIKVRALIHAYRSRAHLKSKTNAVRERVASKAMLGNEYIGLVEADVETELQAGNEVSNGTAKIS